MENFEQNIDSIEDQPDLGRIYRIEYNQPSEIQISFRRESLLFAASLNQALPSITIQNINVQFSSPTIEFRDDLTQIENDLKNLKEKVLTEKDLPIISRYIGNELVGESFLRWDSQVQYYPTLTFIFLEEDILFINRQLSDVLAVQRKVQIKIRATDFESEPGQNQSLSALLKKYELRCSLLENLQFESGNCRCTYVNEGNCKWKTTIFVQNVEEAHTVLSRLCEIIRTPYKRDSLSFTSGKRSTLFQTPCNVKLFKVSLAINKRDKPFIIFHTNL